MTALATAIAKAKPREKSGARTGARYAFQAHVSLAKLLELHQGGSDYRAIFDHFDDLAILDSSTAPALADFFQIKGKEAGVWSAAALCTASAEIPRTTVGKMFHHTTIFGASVRSSTFLTNAPFSFELAAGGKSTPDHYSILLSELAPKDRARISAALDLDFPPPRSPDEGTILKFDRTEVPVKGFEHLLKGRLVDFLSGTDGVIVGAAYRTLIEEIGAKSNDTTDCKAPEEVFSHKSLSRADVQTVLDAAAHRDSILESWSIIDDELKAAHRTSAERIKLKTATIEYLRARSKRIRETAALSAVLKAATAQVSSAIKSASGLLEASEILRQALPDGEVEPHKALALQAALFAEAFEAMNG